MNKLTKIGASALAGSLMSLSANALEVSLSGGASVGIYQSNQTMGSSYFMNDNVMMTISGETDGGLTVTTKLELDAGYTSTAPFDNRSISIANEMGTITFAGHGGDSVMSGWDDKVPNAYEEPWALVAHPSSTANGTAVTLINGMSGDKLWRYDSPSFNGVSVHASYLQAAQAISAGSQGSVSSYNDIGIQIAPEMVEGLTIGYAMGTVQESATIENDESTLWINYVYGPVTLGYQMSEVDGQTTSQDDESDGYGLSYAINDSMSISYGVHTLDLGDKNGAGTDQESSGFSISYTMGGATIAGGWNQVDNVAGNAAVDADGYELSVAFAF
jgi:outer membrane protein OmpU